MSDSSSRIPIPTSRNIARRLNRSGRVLIADDDDAVRRVLTRAVESEGYKVEAVANGDDAARAFFEDAFDLVISDIDMPGRNGIELLQAVRARDMDVPVVLLTGGPSLDTAISAVEHSATRYLTKPVDLLVLSDTLRRTIQAGQLARARRALMELIGESPHQIVDLASLEARFEAALRHLYMVYQPIVRWSDRSVFAYEALVRSAEPSIPHPGALFDTADRLDRVADIGRGVRAICADPVGAETPLLFVNLHTKDLLEESLYDADAPLARIASRVVYEITERARLESVADVPGRIARLREMGFRIALDDIGAGYAGLTSFAALEPDVMKLDMSLVRGIDASNTRIKLVGSMISLCKELGVAIVAEGVETEGERDTLVDLGCDLLQGYLFAKPAQPFVQPDF